MSVSLFELWLELDRAEPGSEWPATFLDDWGGHLARTTDGGAALVVPHRGEVSGPGLQTSHVTYEPACTLSITTSAGVSTGLYSALSCDGSDPELVEHFLRIAGAVLLEAVGSEGFDRAVRGAFELFRQMAQAPKRTIQGLWAELLLIAHAKDPVFLLECWHSDPRATHDFVGQGTRLEVKSSASPIREHDFSLEQLLLSTGNTFVASILLERRPDGASLWELLDTVHARLERASLRERASAIVFETLCGDWRGVDDLRFIVRSAAEKLIVVRASSVPRVSEALPPEVRRVRFVSDLSNVAPVEPHDAEANPLLSALLPLVS